MTGRGWRLFWELILILTAAAFTWEAEGIKRTEKASGDTLTNQELHRLLALFNTTPQPPTAKTTTPSTSFVPTEILPAKNITPKQFARRKDALKPVNVNRDGDAASANLLQQLSVLNSFLEASGVQAQQGTTAAVQEPVPATPSTTEPTPKSVTTQPSLAPPLPVDDQAAALQSLALLSALLGSNGNSGGNNAANLAALLGVDTAPSAPVVRQTQQSNNDPAAMALTSLLLAQAGLGPQQLQQSNQAAEAQQNFQTFSNTQANLDPAGSNQLTSLLTLLGTLGSLAGGSQPAPSLFNFGQSQQSQPNLLTTLLGGHQAQAQPQETNFLATLLGGNQQQQQQNNMLASLLGGQGGANSLFSQPQQQQPGVLASLGNLGTSLFSAAGTTLGGLSGTRSDGKPRVRGVDTRLGLGYRLGQNADAQVMMEIGPQLFTEALPNEHRPGVPAAGVDTNAIRDVRQPSTDQVQQLLQVEQLLQAELEKQSQLQRRNQLQKLSKAELEHQQIGQLLHAAGYWNPPKRAGNPMPPPRPQQLPPMPQMRPQQPPRVRQMFPYRYPGPRPRTHHHYQLPPPRFPTPMNNYYKNMPPPSLLQPQSNPAWNTNNHIRPTSRPTEAARQVPAPSPAVPKPKPSETSESDGYSMLTEYEKWLVKRGASAQQLQSSVAKRMLPLNDENSELSRADLVSSSSNINPQLTPNKNQFSFHGVRESPVPNPNTTGGKIVRMSQKRPATLKSDAFVNRVGNFPREHQSPPLPPQSHFRSPNPMPAFRHPQLPISRNFGPQIPHGRRPPPGPHRGYWSPTPNVRRYQNHGMQPRPPIRRSHQSPPLQHMSFRDHPHPHPQHPPQSQAHPPKSQIDRSSYNPYQNFVMEADDSFLRRNAPANIQNERLESEPKPAVGVTPKPKPSANSEGTSTLDVAVKAGSTAMKVLKEVITPAVKYFRPTVDSLHPFGKPLSGFENGDYTPTKEPLLIATPTPTPVPSLYDHFGRKNPNHADQTPEEQASAVVHVGEGLSYEDLALISPKGRKRKKKPSKDKDVEDSEGEESKVKGPLNAPGVEMFIDIESGEVSVRKPIASLTHFGEVTTTTTAEPEPKTEDEIEDEESGKIFESLQEHFKENFENFQVSQAALLAAKERKEKIKLEQDESLGLVNRYFDLLTDDGDDENPARRRRRQGLDSIRPTRPS